MSRSGRSRSSSSSSSSTNSNHEDSGPSVTKNLFKNDGSFLEMFKKMQDQGKDCCVVVDKKTDNVISSPSTSVSPLPPSSSAPVQLEELPKPKVLPLVGKRRGGRALPTGMVKKQKKTGTTGDDGEVDAPKDAWSQYMAEVRRYKEASCEEEGKTRPLIMPAAVMSSQKLETAPFDPRFPNQNQTRYCYQSYVDFHRCRRVKGEDYAPCEYFRKVYRSMCPNAWIEKWDTQIEENRFPGRL